MGDETRCDVLITDVTLREYAQNVPASSLVCFSPQIRIALARKLIQAGFRSLEVLSCVSPSRVPAMKEESIRSIARGIGRLNHVTLVTLVPNLKGYETFLACGLGTDEYRHSLGIFFSAVEPHNLLNLGRTIEQTLREYEEILRDAHRRELTVTAYISAAFGYRPDPSKPILRPGVEVLGSYLDRLLDMGAHTVTLSDLQGLADEKETRSLLQDLLKERKQEVVEKLGYHPHHLQGERALANSWAAYEAGLRRFDASLGGTGGCITGAPGNQPTEKLVAFLEDKGVKTGIDPGKLAAISRFVEKQIYSKISVSAPPGGTPPFPTSLPG